MIEIRMPSNVPNVKPIVVSYIVTPKCLSKSLALKFIKVLNILLGWLLIKLSIIFKLAKTSQINIIVSKIPNLSYKNSNFIYLNFS